MSDTCCFCLGDDKEIPPFGSPADACDFVQPCKTCAITAHRLCLIEWFNTLPAKKLRVVNAQGIPISNHSDQQQSNNPEDDSNTGIWELTSSNVHISMRRFNFRSGRPNENILHYNFSNDRAPSNTSELPNDHLMHRSHNHTPYNKNLVLLLSACPQCKGDIIMAMKESVFVGLYSRFKSCIRSTVQAGIILGVVSLGVTGTVLGLSIVMTSVGISMVKQIIPGPLAVQLFQKDPINQQFNWFSTHSLSHFINKKLNLIEDGNSILSSASNIESPLARNLDEGFSKGILDISKISRITLLPLFLYKSRNLSFIDSILGFKGINDDSLHNLITELVLNSYISSMGNYKFIRKVAENITTRNPIFQGINWWDPNIIIQSFIPFRIMYDLFYKLVINKVYFNLLMKVRPREVANSLDSDKLQKMEELDSKIAMCEMEFYKLKKTTDELVDNELSSKVASPLLKYVKKKLLYYKACKNSKLPQLYLQKKTARWFEETKACIKNDYSGYLIGGSTTMKCLTTLIWPYIGSKIGTLFLDLVLRWGKINAPRHQLKLIANLIGMSIAVLGKDGFNLYLSLKKAAQIMEMTVFDKKEYSIVNETESNSTVHEQLINNSSTDITNIPGGFSSEEHS